MNKTTHTPGPWYVDTSTALFAVNADPYEGHHEEKYSKHIAMVNYTGEKTYNEQLANAKLIAAAPELLKALQNCLNWMEDMRLSGDAGNWQWEDDEGNEYLQGIKTVLLATGQ